ncbi:hypothetical protein HanPSC8_Chr15g0651951 [Helianthus annuus]|nr:hypothetical protein HanPSC8_Chr15g0651951 [Helianthus annuus]
MLVWFGSVCKRASHEERFVRHGSGRIHTTLLDMAHVMQIYNLYIPASSNQ